MRHEAGHGDAHQHSNGHGWRLGRHGPISVVILTGQILVWSDFRRMVVQHNYFLPCAGAAKFCGDHCAKSILLLNLIRADDEHLHGDLHKFVSGMISDGWSYSTTMSCLALMLRRSAATTARSRSCC